MDTRPALARADDAARSFVMDALSAIILIGSVAAAVAAVVLPVNQLTQPGGATSVELSDTAQSQAIAAIQGLAPGTWMEFGQSGYPMQLHVLELPWPLRLLSESGVSLLLGCLAVAGFLLHRTLRSIRTGTPFEAANPRRLRIIGLLAVVGGLGGQLLEGVSRLAILDHTEMTGPESPVKLSLTMGFTWIVIGALALALAEAFARGRDLSDDVAGLV